jgi:hypothetical protein
MVRLEALNAKHGDSLLLHYKSAGKSRLWVIDGGPGGTWNKYLRPRLEELKGSQTKLVVDVAMLSHVDDDHVNGLVQMTKGLADNGNNAPTFLDIRRFWHNSFTDLVGSESTLNRGMATLSGVIASAETAMAADSTNTTINGVNLKDRREIAVLASIKQGRDLRDYIKKLQLSGNDPFGEVFSSSLAKRKIDGAAVTIVGPIASRLETFRQEWKKAVGKPAEMANLFREDLDDSPTNLSSIVMLVEVEDRKILLTGDARGDDILDGFKKKKLNSKLPMKLDVLKMPHHGSDRNMTEEFLKAFPAKNYIVSADGNYGNPDPNTIKAIVETRGNDRYKIHFTNKVAGLPQLLSTLSSSKRFEYFFRADNALSIVVEL